MLEDLLVLEWVMPLRKGHRAGVEPHIDQLGNATHLPTAITFQRYGVNIRPVKIEWFGKFSSLPPQFIDAANGSL